MCCEVYDWSEEKYQEEVDCLSKIAEKVYHSDHSLFLKAKADAWIHADASNKRILKFAWESIVMKYKLAEKTN